jgi:hypothetical protein
MNQYKITFGTVNAVEEEIIEATSLEQATEIAYEYACEDYESYAGLHGLRDIGDIMEEDGVNENEAEEIYLEERESWLYFDAEPYDEGEEE